MSRKHAWHQAGDAPPSPVVGGLRAVREPRWDFGCPDLVVPGVGRGFSLRPGHTPDDHDGPAIRIGLRPDAP